MDNIIENIICYFFQIQCNIKINHFQTLKYSRHKATDALLDKILDLSDKFVEVYLGHFNVKPKFDSKNKIYITNVDDNEIIILRDKGNILNDEIKGDLKLFIKVENKTQFERKGLDLIIKKQISGFNVTSGSQWEDKMDLFPNVSIGYIKVSDNQSPIRIESLQNPVNLKKDYEYILATSKLLPNYGFPVGLSVVDKFAKIPNWMGKASRNYYTTYFLKEAIKQKNPNTISVALKVLSKSNRSWLTRPTMRRFK